MEGRESDPDVVSNKTVMIRMGSEVAIEVMEMMKLRVVGAYVLGVEMEKPAGVGWVPALRLGAWRGRSRICVHCIKLEGIEDDLSLKGAAQTP